MSVEDFNDLWMKELNSWQKDYFPHLKKEEENGKNTENNIENSFFQFLKPYIEGEDEEIQALYPSYFENANKILVFYEKPNTYPKFDIEKAISMANYSLSEMGLIKNVIFTKRASVPKGIVIIGNTGAFFQRHEKSIYGMAQANSNNPYRFSTDVNYFANQTVENADKIETSTTFPPNNNSYDIGLVRLDLLNTAENYVFQQNKDSIENLAYTFLHILGHNSGFTHNESERDRRIMRYATSLRNINGLKLSDFMFGKYANKTIEEMKTLGIEFNESLNLGEYDEPGVTFDILSNEPYIKRLKNYFKPRKK